MADQTKKTEIHTVHFPVTLASNGFYPQAFRWQGRWIRVRSVESVNTFGTERRYRVRTAEGHFELGLYTHTNSWHLRRAPTWFGRAWARLHNIPRYPLPAWRRRARRMASVPAARGGGHANRLALVRQ